MEIQSLRQLHQSMLEVETDIQAFEVQTGAAWFYCMFSTRETPFTLALTSMGDKPEFFLLEVLDGYRIQPHLNEKDYNRLCKVLRQSDQPFKPLKLGPWLEQLNLAIPVPATRRNIPAPATIMRLRPDITDDRDKPYFLKWVTWDGKKVTRSNQQKTLVMLGPAALQYSKAMNASSAWSPEDLGVRWKEKCR